MPHTLLTFTLQLLTLASCAFLLFADRLPKASAAEPNGLPKRPNILILYADDMGFGDLGIQNPDSKIPTQNLDRLAREGMRFTDAHSSSGICTPSRYALLTGQYHWRKFHDIVNSFEASVIAPDRLTMAGMLNKQGYHTACIGKWHLGWNWDAIRRPGAKPMQTGRNLVYGPEDLDWSKPIPDGPLDHGFETYFGDDVPNFPPYAWIRNDRVTDTPTVMYEPAPKPTEGAPEGRPGPSVKGWQQDEVMPTLTAEVVKYLESRKGQEQPFFLYFPWTSPHAPIVPTPEFQGKTKAGGFGDFMHQSDHHAGQVLDALDRFGLAENTLVIFTADNGPEHYAYPREANFNHRSHGPFRGLKRDIYEGGHHVPFVVRWPGVVKPGSTCDALVSQIDIMATVAAIIGSELPSDAAEDSYNILPLLRGQTPKQPIRKTLVHNTFDRAWAIRSDDWVLIDAKTGYHSRVPKGYDEAHGYDPNDHEAELFNLSEDLGQKKNLIDSHPEKAKELRATLNRIREEGHSAPRLRQKTAAGAKTTE